MFIYKTERPKGKVETISYLEFRNWSFVLPPQGGYRGGIFEAVKKLLRFPVPGLQSPVKKVRQRVTSY